MFDNFTPLVFTSPEPFKAPHANADGLLAPLATLIAHLPAHGVSDIEGNMHTHNMHYSKAL